MSKVMTLAELKAKCDMTEVGDEHTETVIVMVIAFTSFGFDMSVLCGHEQNAITEAFRSAFSDAEGEVTEEVRLAVGRALISVLSLDPCESKDCEIVTV
jgi:ornithine carbamoyltransferase